MATAQQLLDWARSQVGTVEHGGPHGNDGNIVWYWDAIHHHEEQGCPWCDAFVEAGEMALGVPVIVDSQYCPTVEAAYRKAGRLFPVDQAQPGDQLFFHFPGEANEANHTGILETLDVVRKTVADIEGNTSPGAGGSQSNGGGVYRRTRPWSLVRSVGRPVFTADTPMQSVVTGATTGDNVTPHSVHVNKLDDQGDGWVDIHGITGDQVVSMVPNGQDPTKTGYHKPPLFERELVDGAARINIYGGVPNGALDFIVWSTP